VEEIDVDALMSRIRDNVEKRRREGEPPAPVAPEAPPPGEALAEDVAILHQTWDVYNAPLTSPRLGVGTVVTLAKRGLRRLLAPLIGRQVAYNAAACRAIDAVLEQLRAQAAADQARRRERDDLRAELGELRDEARARVEEGRRDTEARDRRVAALGDELRGRAEEQRRVIGALSERLTQLDAERRAAQAQLDTVATQLDAIAAQLDATAAQLDTTAARAEATAAQAAVTAGQHGELAVAVAGIERDIRQARDLQDRALQTLREHVARAERKLRRIQHALDGGAEVPPPQAGSVVREADFDYAGFEERFRGSEGAVKDRQRPYLDHFAGRRDVLEIGCGRGEFLELLREDGVTARGVDLDLDMVLYCREKGLDVVQADALAYLEAIPDDSLGGVFAAQVVEHLETAAMTRLVRLCHRKLQPGGVLVLETLNPECLSVLYRWFWMDLSHVRLVHAQTLQFLVESHGFSGVTCRFLPSLDTPRRIPPLEIRDVVVPELAEFNAATAYLNTLLYSSSDYAVLGTK
jgi:O-antigen chain-terminating methyltransferase